MQKQRNPENYVKKFHDKHTYKVYGLSSSSFKSKNIHNSDFTNDLKTYVASESCRPIVPNFGFGPGIFVSELCHFATLPSNGLDRPRLRPVVSPLLILQRPLKTNWAAFLEDYKGQKRERSTYRMLSLRNRVIPTNQQRATNELKTSTLSVTFSRVRFFYPRVTLKLERF